MEVEINDGISLVVVLKMESDTQEEAQERNILSSISIFKFIMKKRSTPLLLKMKKT